MTDSKQSKNATNNNVVNLRPWIIIMHIVNLDLRKFYCEK